MPATFLKGRPEPFPSRILFFCLAVVVALLLLLLLADRAASQETVKAAAGLQAGFAEADITPQVGGQKPVFMAGFGQNRRASKVHDRLKARAVVLRDGDRKIALACVDLVGLFHASVKQVRRQLPGFAYVLVSSTHNHEGPDTLGLWGPHPFSSGIDPAYVQKVEEGIVQAIRQADQDVRPVKARLGTARAPELVRDSRLPIVKHDELVALRFDGAGEKAAGLVVQWNCHPETLDSKNTEISADFVAATVEYLQGKYHCPVVYLTGTVGGLMTSLGLEIKDGSGKPLADGTFAKTWRYGQLVGQLAERALATAGPVRLTPLEVRSRELFLPLDNKLYILGWNLGVLKRDPFLWSGSPERAEPIKGQLPPGKRYCMKTELAWLRLGELEIAAIPGEIYPELVLSKVQDPPDPGADFPNAAVEPGIYKQLRGRHHLLIGLANDEVGYIIPKRQWDERPPYCYGRKSPQYGEVNSLGPDTAPILCEAFRALVQGKK
jgi:hypothetical protein